MSNKSNFAQALRELTGFDSKAEEFEPAEASTPESDFAEFSENLSGQSPEVETPNMEEDSVEAGQTTITSTMKITGDIKSEDNLFIDGQVFGNITTTENVRARNLIVGDIKADNVMFNKVRLKGNSMLKGNAVVEDDSIIVGNIYAENIKLAGKVKGDLDINGAAVLLEKALVVGNIVVSTLATESGARIDGNISTNTKSRTIDEDEEFDLGGDF